MSRTWWLLVAWALLIEGLLLWPHPPDVSGEWYAFGGIDKVVHAGLFAVQGWITASTFRQRGRAWRTALFGVMAFGAFTELQQHFIPTRSMEFSDFMADSLGAAIGVLGFVQWAQWRRELDR